MPFGARSPSRGAASSAMALGSAPSATDGAHLGHRRDGRLERHRDGARSAERLRAGERRRGRLAVIGGGWPGSTQRLGRQ